MPELITCKTLITYIIAKIRKNTLFGALGKVFGYIRRFVFITRIFRYIRITAAIIEASAVLILFAAVFAVLLPILLLVLLVLAASDFFIGRRILEGAELANALAREQVYVISEVGHFGDAFARELAQGGAAVFVICVSPTERFVCASVRGGVYYIRHSFYFRLKRKKLMRISDKTVYLI